VGTPRQPVAGDSGESLATPGPPADVIFTPRSNGRPKGTMPTARGDLKPPLLGPGHPPHRPGYPDLKEPPFPLQSPVPEVLPAGARRSVQEPS